MYKATILVLLIISVCSCSKPEKVKALPVTGEYEVIFTWQKGHNPEESNEIVLSDEIHLIEKRLYTISGDTNSASDDTKSFILKGKDNIFPTEIIVNEPISGEIKGYKYKYGPYSTKQKKFIFPYESILHGHSSPNTNGTYIFKIKINKL
jgi:hypothetical protein